MLRRRLVLSSSSDEEPDQPHFHSLPDTPELLSGRNHNPTSDQPLEISDDEDFVDVSDDLPHPSPPTTSSDVRMPAPPPPPAPAPAPNFGGCPISEFLYGRVLGLGRDWLDSCLRGLEESVPGFSGLEAGGRAKHCFEKFLASDMNLSGGGVLPESVDRLHQVDLPGPYVLQVDEIVNISCPLKGRYQKAPPGVKRCLKLSMTDGVQRVFGMEYRPIKDLDALAPAGLKVVICNVHVRYGILMLVPETFEVLGGFVEELEAARQRLVDEVNKPPRGIRTRNRVIPPLRSRATLAAWQPNGTDVAPATNEPTPVSTSTPFQVRPQGTASVGLRTDSGHSVVGEASAIRDPSSNVRLSNSISEASVFHDRSLNVRRSNSISEASAIRDPASNVRRSNSISEASDVRAPSSNARHSSSISEASDVHTPSSNVQHSNFVRNPSSNTVVTVEELPDITMFAEEDDVHMHPVRSSTTSYNTLPNTSSDTALVTEAIDMDTTPENAHIGDEDVEHPLILSGARETPFTYLASLSAKWVSMRETFRSIKGTIKCILTGVKGFQFKDRTAFELQAYVDDGSLISEIIIHHDVVRKKIGYSPQEVTAAIASPDPKIVHNMRQIMKQYQSFLANFEGKMIIQMNSTSPLPVALEMSQGCSESDAKLLFRRLNSSLRSQTQPSVFPDPIDLSP